MSWRTAFIEQLGPGGFSGTTFGDWLRVLRNNRFAIDAKFWPRAALISGNSVVNSLVRHWERLRYGGAIAGTPVHPPLFILGIWRSGTTHLHNLLAKDDRFAFPNTYEVLYPHTFLTTEPIGSRVMQWMMPPTRPMDNVRSGIGEPQEDEFALVASGLSFMLGPGHLSSKPPPLSEIPHVMRRYPRRPGKMGICIPTVSSETDVQVSPAVDFEVARAHGSA